MRLDPIPGPRIDRQSRNSGLGCPTYIGVGALALTVAGLALDAYLLGKGQSPIFYNTIHALTPEPIKEFLGGVHDFINDGTASRMYQGLEYIL